MHFQCWSFYHRSQKYGHVPSTRHHSVSCGQLSVFTSGIKQCIFLRYLSVSFRRTYYGHILSLKNIFCCIFVIIETLKVILLAGNFDQFPDLKTSPQSKKLSNPSLILIWSQVNSIVCRQLYHIWYSVNFFHNK